LLTVAVVDTKIRRQSWICKQLVTFRWKVLGKHMYSVLWIYLAYHRSTSCARAKPGISLTPLESLDEWRLIVTPGIFLPFILLIQTAIIIKLDALIEFAVALVKINVSSWWVPLVWARKTTALCLPSCLSCFVIRHNHHYIKANSTVSISLTIILF